MNKNLFKKINIFIFIILFSCSKKDKNDLLGKWYYKVSGTYYFYTLEFFDNNKFKKEGYRFNDSGIYNIIEKKKNYYLVQFKSKTGDFDKLIKVYIKDKYIELQDEGKNEIWYSQNSEEAKNIMYNAEKNFQHPSQYKSFDHYYLEKFALLNKTVEDLEEELGLPDSISPDENDSLIEIWLYGKYGTDEKGNLYSYQFYIKDGKVIKVNFILQN